MQSRQVGPAPGRTNLMTCQLLWAVHNLAQHVVAALKIPVSAVQFREWPPYKAKEIKSFYGI